MHYVAVTVTVELQGLVIVISAVLKCSSYGSLHWYLVGLRPFCIPNEINTCPILSNLVAAYVTVMITILL